MDGVGRRLVATEHLEWNPALSPDGRWLAYVSDGTGQREVYVRPFPDVDSTRWPVSTAGGQDPKWTHSGDELFYRNAANELVRVEVTIDPTFANGEEEVLFGLRGYLRGGGYPMYDVTSDGRQFVMLRAAGPSEETADVGRLFLGLNFFEEMKRLWPN